MSHPKSLVVFILGEERYGLFLSSVEKIVQLVHISPLPKAPDVILGIINVQGKIIPVFDMHKRFSIPKKESQLSDQLIIAHTNKRQIALKVDKVLDVITQPEEAIVASEKVLPQMEYIEGVAKLESGLILIHNLDQFLSLYEEEALQEAMKGI